MRGLASVGAVAIAVVFAGLFLPDWQRHNDLTGAIDAPAGTPGFHEALAGYLNVPLLRGGEAQVLQNGDRFFPAMLESIRSARETVDLEVYILEPDGIGTVFLNALEERCRAGVDVRLLVDAFGSHKLDEEWRARLRKAGCRVSRYRPLEIFSLNRVHKRNHRRAIVVDGRVAFTGGGAIADKWVGSAQDPDHWRDNMVRVSGPLAAGVQAAFVESWLYATGEALAGRRFFPAFDVAPLSPAGGDATRPEDAREAGPVALALVSSPSDAAQPIRLLYWLSFRAARKRIYVASSYFIPGKAIREELERQGRAGLDVRILVPGENTDAGPVQRAGRSCYEELLEAGVRIFEYAPTMMHSKTVVVDGVWSIVGSSNMDERSTEINEENNLAIRDSTLAREIKQGLLADMQRSREIRLADWRRRSWRERLLERLSLLLVQQY